MSAAICSSSQSQQNPYQLSFPHSPKDCVSIICNSDMTFNEDLTNRIASCRMIIGVDEGLNYCAADTTKITLNCCVIDLYLIESDVVEKLLEKHPNAFMLLSQKHLTSLEVAINKAQKVAKIAQIIIWGGIGKHIDQTLSNILFTTHSPGKIILESGNEVVFTVSSEMGNTVISHLSAKSISLFPLTGAAKEISLTSDEGYTNIIPSLDRCRPKTVPFNKQCTINIESGELLVILSQDDIVCTTVDKTETPQEFLSSSFVSILDLIAQHSDRKDTRFWKMNSDMLYSLRSSTGIVTFECNKNERFSMFPLYGTATGVRCTRTLPISKTMPIPLLNKSIHFDKLPKPYNFSVSLETGEVVCIIRKVKPFETMLILEPSEIKNENESQKRPRANPKIQTQEDISSIYNAKNWVMPLLGLSGFALALVADRYFKNA